MRVPRRLKNSGAVVAKKTSLLEVMSDKRGMTIAWIRLPLMTSRTSIESAVKAKMYGKAQTEIKSHNKYLENMRN